MTRKRGQKRLGRPPSNDDAALLSLMNERMAQGLSASEAAKAGAIVVGYDELPNGQPVRTITRIKASTLLRRYNAYIKSVGDTLKLLSDLSAREGTRLKGLSKIPKEFSFISLREPGKRGRPKKIRQANHKIQL